MTAATLATSDLTPRIATEVRTDKETLLSGVHAGAIRELLERRGVLWDNTGTMHRARPYDPDPGRMLTRTKLAGEEPFA